MVGKGGRRVIDFWVTAGNRVALIEVKYQLPTKAGTALTRLTNQMKTYSTAEEAVRNGAQVVLFTYKAPSNAQMNLLLSRLGAEHFNSVQLVHGLTGLGQWVKFFFTGTP